MVTSVQNRQCWILLVYLGFSSPSWACDTFNAPIRIKEWKLPLPNTVELMVISDSTSSEEPPKKTIVKYSAKISPPVPAYDFGPSLLLTPEKNIADQTEKITALRVKDKYVLLLDGNPVYNISNIESKRPDLGCYITSFKVNSCTGGLNPYLQFDASCR